MVAFPCKGPHQKAPSELSFGLSLTPTSVAGVEDLALRQTQQWTAPQHWPITGPS